MTHPGDRIKKLSLNKIGGYPRVKKTQRNSQDKNIVQGVVDEIGTGRSKSISWSTKEGSKPLGEGTNIWSKEGVEGVGECVVGTEPAIGDTGQSQARPHGIHHVRTRAWHGFQSGYLSAARINPQASQKKKQRN